MIRRISSTTGVGMAIWLAASSIPAIATAQVAEEDTPQEFVVCRGIHALCSFADHCELSEDGQSAACDCWVVEDDFIVVTDAILDPTAKSATQKECTSSQPCGTDQAPVCTKIEDGTYTVDGVTVWRVSAFSYTDFCRRWQPVDCDSGPWASCMAAACQQGDNPQRPALCTCPVDTSPFTGPSGSCEQPPGMVMSTVASDFDLSVLPGSQWAKEPCQHLP